VGNLDYAVLGTYLALLIGLGFWAKHRQKDVEDYYVAGRRLNAITVACLWIAAWIGGAAVVGTTTRVYEYGVTGVWYVLAQATGCVLFGLFVAARIKRLGDQHRHLTYPDFIEQHYDSRTRIVATATTVIAFTAYSAGQFAASAAILQVMVGWDYEICLLVAGVIVILYTAVGGYLAVTYTDWLQVVLLLFGVVVVGIPVAMAAAGSWGDMQSALPDSYYDLGAQGWDRIAALVVSMVLAFFVGMDSFSRSFAARSPGAARNGALLAAVLIVPLAIAAVWLGLAAAVLYPDHGAAGSSVLATFVLDRFPAGLKGLMLVAVLSAIMSTADICILTASANYTRDIHQRYIRPDMSQRDMLRLGTFASVVVGLLSMLLAWKMRDIIDILQLGFTINAAGLFLPTVAALYGNRVSAGAAFWSIGASLVTVIGWRIAADAGAGGIFAIDPLWPGLAVSAVLLFALTALHPRRAAGTAA
jgi:SSS family solute:Na+ symporter